MNACTNWCEGKEWYSIGNCGSRRNKYNAVLDLRSFSSEPHWHVYHLQQGLPSFVVPSFSIRHPVSKKPHVSPAVQSTGPEIYPSTILLTCQQSKANANSPTQPCRLSQFESRVLPGVRWSNSGSLPHQVWKLARHRDYCTGCNSTQSSSFSIIFPCILFLWCVAPKLATTVVIGCHFSMQKCISGRRW